MADNVKTEPNPNSTTDSTSNITVPPSLDVPPDLHPDDEPSVSILYVCGGALPKLQKYLYKIIEVRVPAEDLTLQNKEVSTRKLWGTDTYTDDSDPVAILVHTGTALIRAQTPSYTGLSIYFRVLPPLESKNDPRNYIGSIRYGYRSRSWQSQYERYSLQVVKVNVIEGSLTQLQRKSLTSPTATSNLQSPAGMKQEDKSTPAPTPRGRPSASTAPPKMIRMLSSNNEQRTSGRTTGRSKRRFVPDVSLLFSSNSNTPILRYALGFVGDRGLQENEWMASRLRRECYYMEHNQFLYELALDTRNTPKHSTPTQRNVTTTTTGTFDKYKFSQIDTTKINPFKRRYAEQHVPLREDVIQILADNLDCEELEFGSNFIVVRGKPYVVTTFNSKQIHT